MRDLQEAAQRVQTLLSEKGAQQFQFTVAETEKQELNTENTAFTLFRTIFNSSVSVTVIQDGKKGAASGNDLTDEGLEKVADDAMTGAESSMPDEANAIAEAQAPETFHAGPYEAQLERFYDRLTEFLEDVGHKYPKVKILQLIADHVKEHVLYQNSNGTRFEDFSGVYHVTLEMSASDGERTTGLDYVEIATVDLDTPFMEQGNIAAHLADTERSLIPAEIPDKFEGTVVFTPDCLGSFIYMLLSNYAMNSVILDGTSQWLNKLGQQVASEKVTMRLTTQDDRIPLTSRFTEDGYKAENVTILDRGVLKNHILNLYIARKTGRPVTKNTGFDLVMEPGETPVKDMIASIKKGLIVGGFSGGEPGTNGEFSGVAKNSFYIENGQIKGAVTETMINGNLEKVFQNVSAISKELVCDGSTVLPYLACEGIVISGK